MVRLTDRPDMILDVYHGRKTTIQQKHRPSALENKYSKIFFYKTAGPTVLKFHMEHDLTPGSQNCKTGLSRIPVGIQDGRYY